MTKDSLKTAILDLRMKMPTEYLIILESLDAETKKLVDLLKRINPEESHRVAHIQGQIASLEAQATVWEQDFEVKKSPNAKRKPLERKDLLNEYLATKGSVPPKQPMGGK